MAPVLESSEIVPVVPQDPETRYLAERELVEQRIGSDAWKKIDAIDRLIAEQPGSFRDLPVKHIFTPHLYTREIFMPKGVFLTTRVHLTGHPFVISLGVVSVWSDESGWQLIRAPFTGVTKPGTRRILFMHEDTIWTTFHVTDETDPEKIVEQLTYDHRRLTR